ncbi:hypothetical protein SCHPADRAFT_894815 [Schizopora paradoxa]|uniref:Uncharacterized protein n=1 Tax=Schizopora paradoxa TaxID=27342 RepID=A0A0H2RR00_9AGAM|nr:hypothetical protein SCHPADRAFT_894815 [Schizopora paradoxa]
MKELENIRSFSTVLKAPKLQTRIQGLGAFHIVLSKTRRVRHRMDMRFQNPKRTWMEENKEDVQNAFDAGVFLSLLLPICRGWRRDQQDQGEGFRQRSSIIKTGPCFNASSRIRRKNVTICDDSYELKSVIGQAASDDFQAACNPNFHPGHSANTFGV